MDHDSERRPEWPSRNGDEEIADTLEDLPLESRNDALALLMELFPFAQSVWGNHAWEPQGDWATKHRICSSSYFDRYFAYGTPVGDISSTVIQEFVSDIGSHRAGPDDLRRLMTQHHQGIVIQRLLDDSRSALEPEAKALIRALAEVSEDFEPPPPSIDRILSPINRAAVLVCRLLLRVTDVDRQTIAEDVVNEATSLMFVSETLIALESLSGADSPEPVLDDSTIRELESMFARRLSDVHGYSPFFNSYGSAAPWIYNHWMRLTSRDEVDQAIQLATSTFPPAMQFLRTFGLSGPGGNGAGLYDTVMYDFLTAVTDPETLLGVLVAEREDAAVATRDQWVTLDEDGRQIARFADIFRSRLAG